MTPALPDAQRTNRKPLSNAQKMYLLAFERWLRDPTERTECAKAHHLARVMQERNLMMPSTVLGKPHYHRSSK